MVSLNLDSTQISTWLECRRKWYLGFHEHLVPLNEAKAFSTGKLIHRMLELYYRGRLNGLNPRESVPLVLECIKNWLNTGSFGNRTVPGTNDWLAKIERQWAPEWKDTMRVQNKDWSFYATRFIAYSEFYGADRFRVIDVEVGFAYPILQTTEHLFVLEGRIDLLLQDKSEGDYYWVDHKSQERDTDYYMYSPQFLNYCTALETRHGMINYFGLQQNIPKGRESYFRRQPMIFSREILKEWKLELISIFSEISRETAFRKNRVACKHGLNRTCDFIRICEQTDPRFENEVKRIQFREREPWSPWRLEENGA